MIQFTTAKCTNPPTIRQLINHLGLTVLDDRNLELAHQILHFTFIPTIPSGSLYNHGVYAVLKIFENIMHGTLSISHFTGPKTCICFIMFHNKPDSNTIAFIHSIENVREYSIRFVTENELNKEKETITGVQP
jgi:hypothetical protein